MVKICNLYIYLKILNGYLFGISSENVSFSLVVGWIKLILLANSAIFILLEFFPYFESPNNGWFLLENCTLIWCGRPVIKFISINDRLSFVLSTLYSKAEYLPFYFVVTLLIFVLLFLIK